MKNKKQRKKENKIKIIICVFKFNLIINKINKTQ